MRTLRAELKGYVEEFDMVKGWQDKVREWVGKIQPDKGSKLKLYMSLPDSCVLGPKLPDRTIII